MDQTIKTHLRKSDPVMARIIATTELPELPKSEGIYHDLVSCVVDQQIPARSRGVYMKKLVGLLKGEAPDGNNIYAIQEDDWAAAKMARPKYHTLFRLTDAWHKQGMAGQDWSALADNDVRAHLTAIKGIGPQTADLILLYSLGRSDVFLANDYHIKKKMEALYLEDGEKLKTVISEVSAKWAPYRSVATRYLLAGG